jgi:hypothetical protein
MVIAANLIKENEIKEPRPNSGSCHNMTKKSRINTILEGETKGLRSESILKPPRKLKIKMNHIRAQSRIKKLRKNVFPSMKKLQTKELGEHPFAIKEVLFARK